MQPSAIILGFLFAAPLQDDPPAASQEAFARAFSLACERGDPEELAALVRANPRWVFPHFEQQLDSWLRRSSELDERAEAALEQARTLAETVADSQGVYGLVEIVESAVGLPEQAVTRLEQAREDYSAGSQAVTDRDFARALPLLQGATEVFEQLHFWSDAAIGHLKQGNALFYLRRAAEASPEFSRALDLREEVWDLAGAATAALSLAICEGNRGNYRRAIEIAEQSRSYAEAVQDRAGVSRGLGMAAQEWLFLGNPQQALELAERSLALAEELGDNTLRGSNLGVLGECHAALSEYRAAVDCSRRALLLARQQEAPDQQAGCLTNMALSLMQMGEPRQALEALEESLQVQREHGTSRSRHRSRTLEALGMCWRRLDDTERARAYFEQAVVAYREEGSNHGEALTLGNLGVLSFVEGDAARALEYELAGLALLDRVGVEGHARCNALHRIGLCKLDLGDARGALAAFEEFGAALDQVPRTQLAEADRIQFVVPWGDLPGEVSRLALALLRAGEPAALDLAFPLLERFRGRALLEGLAERAEAVLAVRSPELGTRRHELAADLEARRVELARAVEASARPEDLAPLREGIAALEEKLMQNERALRRSDPRLAELVLPSEVSLAQVQEAVPTGAGLLLFILEDDASYVWTISRESAEVRQLAAGEVIRAAASTLLEVLRRPGAALDFVAPARELYQMLLAPEEPFLREHRHLILVPDGVLSFLPFEVLLSRDPDAARAGSPEPLPYLVRDLAVEYSPSASLRVLREPRDEPHSWKKEILLVGDPVLEGGPSGVDESRWRASLGTLRFARLQKTRDEVLGIAQSLVLPEESEVAAALPALGRSGHVSGRRFDLLLGSEASAAALGGDLRGYRILHLATHGFCDTEFPWFSGLVLSSAPGASGFLNLMDIGALRLDAEIVFLSACDTALGRSVKGEGIQNLARGFLLAGANSVVATAWAVRDDVAPILAQAFYAGVREGKDAPMALRGAKLRLLDAASSRRSEPGGRGGEVVDGAPSGVPGFGHPACWAPFVLWSRAP